MAYGCPNSRRAQSRSAHLRPRFECLALGNVVSFFFVHAKHLAATGALEHSATGIVGTARPAADRNVDGLFAVWLARLFTGMIEFIAR